MMMDQATKAQTFRELHVKGTPLVLFNAWDAGSAAAVAKGGAAAIATGSWSVAAAQGFARTGKLCRWRMPYAQRRRSSLRWICL